MVGKWVGAEGGVVHEWVEEWVDTAGKKVHVGGWWRSGWAQQVRWCGVYEWVGTESRYSSSCVYVY